MVGVQRTAVEYVVAAPPAEVEGAIPSEASVEGGTVAVYLALVVQISGEVVVGMEIEDIQNLEEPHRPWDQRLQGVVVEGHYCREEGSQLEGRGHVRGREVDPPVPGRGYMVVVVEAPVVAQDAEDSGVHRSLAVHKDQALVQGVEAKPAGSGAILPYGSQGTETGYEFVRTDEEEQPYPCGGC